MAGAVAGALRPALDAGRPVRKSGRRPSRLSLHAALPATPPSSGRCARPFHRGASSRSRSLRAPAADAERKTVQPLLEASDALVAFAFRDGETTSPQAIDALKRPWWPAFGTAGHGVRSSADGSPAEGVAESLLDPLSGNPRVDLANDLSQNDASVSAFHLAVREPAHVEGLSLGAGDRIDFRLPSQTEMLFQLGSVLAGKHFALGTSHPVRGPVGGRASAAGRRVRGRPAGEKPDAADRGHGRGPGPQRVDRLRREPVDARVDRVAGFQLDRGGPGRPRIRATCSWEASIATRSTTPADGP